MVRSKLLKYPVFRFLLSDAVDDDDIEAGEKHPKLGRISEHSDPLGN